MSTFEQLQQLARQAQIPLTLHLDVTRRCNLRCSHCFIADHEPPGLPLPQVQELLEDAASLGSLMLLLGGGEPLLREDLPELIHRARTLRYAVKLNTNATLLTPQLADRLANLQLLEVGVSLYSLQPAIHDGITGQPGSQAATLRGIRLLQERGLRLELKTMVMPANRRGWRGIVELARELNAGLVLDSTIMPREAGDPDHVWVHRLTPQEQLEVAAAQQAYLRARDETAPGDPRECSLGAPASRQLSEFLCSGGRSAAYVHPSGRVQPCMFWPLELGDLHREHFGDIWEKARSDRRLQLTRQMMKGCGNCPHLGHCGLCPGLQQQLSGDPLLRHELMCQRTEVWQRARTAPEGQVQQPGPAVAPSCPA